MSHSQSMEKQLKFILFFRGTADGEEYAVDVGLAAELGDLHEDIVVAEESVKVCTGAINFLTIIYCHYC